MTEQFLLTIFGSGISPASIECVRRFCSASDSKPRVMEGCSEFLLPCAPPVKRNDLLALGLKPGPEIGSLLTEIRDKQLQEELKTREEALAWAKGKTI